MFLAGLCTCFLVKHFGKWLLLQELDAIIERAKMATIELRSEEDTEDEGEMSMYCITCGHEIHSRMAIKHMEKCFNKVRFSYRNTESHFCIYTRHCNTNICVQHSKNCS